jgi:hypothetical protein
LEAILCATLRRSRDRSAPAHEQDGERFISFVVTTSSFPVPVAFHQLEDVSFAFKEKHDSKPRNNVAEIDDGIRFDPASPRRRDIGRFASISV